MAKFQHESQILVHDLPSQPDPRIYASQVFNPQPGITGPPKLATASTKTKINGREATFSVPSHSALCLNISHKAFEAAKQIPSSALFFNESYGLSAEKGLTQLYDLLELLISNIIFAHTGLEAYANQMVPDDFIFTTLRQDKKCEESYSKDQIERNLSLDTKLSAVLPAITEVSFEKGSSLWTSYASLRDIRDRIIHAKSVDFGVKDSNASSLWNDLLHRRHIDSSIIAHKIMTHFPQPQDNSSPVAQGRYRWLADFPF